jgi:catechol 2,3-dioxygenase-like lactoylglutathione lyase family enzyme
MPVTIEAIDHFVLAVREPETSARFYESALGMRVERFRAADGSLRLALAFGRQKINLHRAGAGFRPHAARPCAGSGDFCLLTTDRLEDWAAHLAALGIAIEEGPVARTGATGPLTSLYIRDPDGNLVEIARQAG